MTEIIDVEGRLSKYAYTPYRSNLIDKAADGLDYLISNNQIDMDKVKSIHAVGSFLTNKDEPGDIDIYVSVRGKPKKCENMKKVCRGVGQKDSVMYNYPSLNVHKSYKMEGKDVAHVIVTRYFPRSKFTKSVKLYP